MASIRCFTYGTICISGSNVLSLTKRNGDVYQQKFAVEAKDDKSDDAKDSGSENNDEKNVTAAKNRILASSCSESGKYLALCDDLKQLHLYKYDEQWKFLNLRSVARRCTALTFTSDDQYVLVADKTGDVYRFRVEDSNHGDELILGHLSMLLDIVVAQSDRFVVTCDRDEKIRVSCYPNAYSIHSYCLQHTEYVATVLYIKDHDVLVSGGGDGKIILWNLDGLALCEVDCKEANQKLKGTSSTESENGTNEKSFPVKKCTYEVETQSLCVCFYNSSQVHAYKLNFTENHQSCDLCDVVKVSKEPWDICCSNDQKLFILQPVEDEALVVCDIREENGTIKCSKSNEDGNNPLTTELEKISKDWDFFKDSTDIPSMYQGLVKVKIDQNMKDYLEKKQIRLSGQKIPQPPSKKIKQR